VLKDEVMRWWFAPEPYNLASLDQCAAALGLRLVVAIVHLEDWFHVTKLHRLERHRRSLPPPSPSRYCAYLHRALHRRPVRGPSPQRRKVNPGNAAEMPQPLGRGEFAVHDPVVQRFGQDAEIFRWATAHKCSPAQDLGIARTDITTISGISQ
jgi:hypothetical protein